jgi:hypothetical protein
MTSFPWLGWACQTEAMAKKKAAKKVAPRAGKKRVPKAVAKPAGKKNAKKKASPRKPAGRADLGAPIDGFFAKQPPPQRSILEELRGLVEEAVPGAESAIKWGMPFYTLGGAPVCALTAHKSHVNLVLAGPPGTFDDPDGLLTGDGKTGRHLKLTHLDELPRATVLAWLRTAARVASAKS